MTSEFTEHATIVLSELMIHLFLVRCCFPRYRGGWFVRNGGRS